MKTIRQILCYAWILIAVVMTGCSETSSTKIEFVQIEGVNWACNVNSSYATFGAGVESEEALELELPVSDGDLLYMLQDDLEFYCRYSSSLGSRLMISFDTLNAVSVYLNGNLDYMELSEPSNLEAFRLLTDAEVKQLSTLHLQSPISDDLLSVLKTKEAVLSGKGLVVFGDPGSKNFREVLSICQPSFLVVDDLPEPQESSCLSNLEFLWLEGNISALAKLARCCGSLESLIISNWDPLPGELLPLSELSKLQSFTITDSELTSLSLIEYPPSLSSMFLIGCDTLSDIKKLEELADLKRLGFSHCARVAELDPIYDMHSLKWLSFPPGTTQEEFEELTEQSPKLKVAELIGCTEIVNLAPLQNLPDLKGLVLELEQEQLGMLDSLVQLELLILTNEVFEDNPEWVKELREALPNSTIVPGSGICLGSGWLVMLIPFILLFRVLLRHKE